MPPRRKRKHGQIESEIIIDNVTILDTTIEPGRMDARKIKNNTKVLRASIASINPAPASHPLLETYPDVPPNEMSGLGHADDDEPYEDELWEPGKTESRATCTLRAYNTMCTDFLEELLSMEVNPRAAQPCRCNREGSTALYRCLDCDHPPIKCKECVLSAHQHLALHRIERWDGNHFAAASLLELGHILYLGHNGDPCPCMSVDLTPSSDPAPIGNKRTSEQISVVHTQGIRSVAIRYCICPSRKAPHVN
ncbi:hypothetical protein BOTBODRAFT_174095 [Botryobasidium botryosum FD-172 SS1]|uniref:CxC2-like cysteine cluster KDZ transposase-associated domain-containing protein n=1 Tax=Botryobasidium botryosum (strain FD-172 SS1) TaxID=930990 RepID=A0A067MHH8_BOTB1|nr:hypothetical protein BOTBODRAFT_174095 [Botryobasidium botryosum FD-172 SS1]